MRLWSVHPKLLDQKALVACWRETLLAQAVLCGKTRGYHRHPQLERWRAHDQPLAALGGYLAALWWQADERGYRFNAEKIIQPPPAFATNGALAPELQLPLSDGQLRFELEHLRAKIAGRAPAELWRLDWAQAELAAPSFRLVSGGIASWERGAH